MFSNQDKTKISEKQFDRVGTAGGNAGVDYVCMSLLVRKNSAVTHASGKRRRVDGDADVSGQEASRGEGSSVAAGRSTTDEQGLLRP